MTDGADETKLLYIWQFDLIFKHLGSIFPLSPPTISPLDCTDHSAYTTLNGGGGWGDKGIRELMLDSNKIE